jgi:hypothetical protein
MHEGAELLLRVEAGIELVIAVVGVRADAGVGIEDGRGPAVVVAAIGERRVLPVIDRRAVLIREIRKRRRCFAARRDADMRIRGRNGSWQMANRCRPTR